MFTSVTTTARDQCSGHSQQCWQSDLHVMHKLKSVAHVIQNTCTDLWYAYVWHCRLAKANSVLHVTYVIHSRLGRTPLFRPLWCVGFQFYW